MERLILLLALAAFLFATAVAVPRPSATDFIRSSCRSTRYPALCEQCLFGYAGTIRRNSPRQLAHAALNVTLGRAQSASAFLGRLPSGPAASARSAKAGPVRDCIENLGYSVDQLRRSVAQMCRMGRAGTPGFAWRVSNLQTWVSAALTDETTCLDGVSAAGSAVDPALKAAIRGRIVGLTQVTSNALALVNQIPH